MLIANEAEMARLALLMLAILGCGGSNVPPQFWTARTSSTGNSLFGVGISGAQVVAVGALGTIVTSSDGISWALRTSAAGYNLLAVASSGSLTVAVGDQGKIVASGGLATWTPRTYVTANRLRGVA
jgi:hypothetical protein